MKYKIISDGTAAGTQMIDLDTNKPLYCIDSIVWTIDTETYISKAVVTFANVGLELESGETISVELDSGIYEAAKTIILNEKVTNNEK